MNFPSRFIRNEGKAPEETPRRFALILGKSTESRGRIDPPSRRQLTPLQAFASALTTSRPKVTHAAAGHAGCQTRGLVAEAAARVIADPVATGNGIAFGVNGVQIRSNRDAVHRANVLRTYQSIG